MRPQSLKPNRAAALTSLALCSLYSQAQTANPPEAPTETGKLQSIMVTAERRSANIVTVPMAVSVMRGEALETLQLSGETIVSLAARTPSVNAETSAGRLFPRFYIRGYGNTDFQVNSSQPVSLVYDDVVQENAYLKGFPLFDIDQVEVLRGPQGSLFGRNSPAGVIKFDSVKPGRKFEGYGSLTYGSHNTVNLEAAVNTPLGKEWALRVAMLGQHRDNWVRNTAPTAPNRRLEGYDDNAVRVQMLYQPGADFSALFNVHAREMTGSQRLFRANAIVRGTNRLVPDFDLSRTAIDAANSASATSAGGSLRLRWALGEHALHAITGYETLRTQSHGDIDGGIDASRASDPNDPAITPFPSETSARIPHHRQLSQELRAESLYAGPWNWQAGLYAFDENYDFTANNHDTLAGGAINNVLRMRQRTRALAAFGSISWQLASGWKLQTGLRQTWDRKQFNTESVQGSTPAGPLSADPRDAKLSWDLSLSHALSPDATVYTRAANAYRGTSVQPPSLFAPLSIARPETNTSIEAGIKADVLDHTARVSLTAFHYVIKNQQLTVIGGASNANTLVNARRSVGQGLEFDLRAQASDRLLLTAGLSWNKTRIDDPGLTVSACGNGCTVQDPIVTAVNPAAGVFAPVVSIHGNPLPQAPKWTAQVSARYAIPTADGEWYVFTDWAYRGRMNLFLYEAAEYTARPSLEGGLRLGYSWGHGQYELAVFARNITNQIRITGAVDFNNLTAFTTEPRTVGAQLRATF